jgi:hypothetical protein
VPVVRAGVEGSIGLGGGSTPGNMCPLLVHVHHTTAACTQACGKVKFESSLGAVYQVCVIQENIAEKHRIPTASVYLHLE